MGTSLTKITTGIANAEIISDHLPTTPEIRILKTDPRSPTCDFTRTPIEVLRTPFVKDLISSLDNTPKGIVRPYSTDNSIDPRSPSIEFHRTPVILENNLRLRNKHLENVDIYSTTTGVTGNKDIDESSSLENSRTNIIPPILLDSTPITVKVPSNKRYSVVGLLETNIDFVETNLDTVINEKFSEVQDKLEIKEEELNSDVTSTNIKEDALDLKDKSSTTKLIDDVELKDITADQIQIFENLEIDTKSIDEFDKKLTNLIYEDKQTEPNFKAKKTPRSLRVPLGDRNYNTQQRKTIHNLKVSDKPIKLHNNMSKIPILNEKKSKKNGNVQCENTPPRILTKHTQWGQEDSIII